MVYDSITERLFVQQVLDQTFQAHFLLFNKKYNTANLTVKVCVCFIFLFVCFDFFEN